MVHRAGLNDFEEKNSLGADPGAARSKVWVCRRSFPVIVVSNTAGGMDVCNL